MAIEPSSVNKPWALILGGSSGIGLACAKKLAESGYNLIVIHRTRKNEEAALLTEASKWKKNGVDSLLFNENALDSTIRDKIIQQLIQTPGTEKIRVVIHSIAKGNLKRFTGEEPLLNKEDFELTIHAMATSWWEWVRDLKKNNLLAPQCCNVSFTSEGNKKYIPYYGAVSAAKSTLETLNRYMAVELYPQGIRTNLVQSGVVDTPSLRLIPNSQKILDHTVHRNPGGRLTQPQDIANVVYLLTLPEAAWINGTIIRADGGESLV